MTAGPADFGSRFSAFMIDAALLFVAQWVVVALLSRQLQAVGMTSQDACAFDAERICESPNALLGALLTLAVIASTVGYHAFCEGRFAATPGKYWMGLRVAEVDGSMPIGLGRATVRSLVRQSFWLVLFVVLTASPLSISAPSALFLLLPLLAFAAVASAAFTADNRGAHDHLAGTRVVRIKPLEADVDAIDLLFDGPLWSDPNQPEDLPEHLADEDPDLPEDELDELDRGESV